MVLTFCKRTQQSGAEPGKILGGPEKNHLLPLVAAAMLPAAHELVGA
jgi:hypothetical protein